MTTRLRPVTATAFLAAGIFVSATVDVANVAQQLEETGHSALSRPSLSIEYQRGQLMIDGFTSSPAHEQALSQLAAEKFGAPMAALTFKPLVTPPDYWERITINLLNVVAATRTASVAADERSINIRGITDDGSAWNDNLEALRAVTPSNVAINAEIMVIQPMPPVAELCLRTFAQASNATVGFKQSSTEIRTSSHPLLDAIIDIAYDCQDTTIAITGHSDATGNELTNKRLSLARAQAVADYLTRAGLAPDRLLVTGAGSLFPVADYSNALGRRRNRRVEFEMLPAEPQAAL